MTPLSPVYTDENNGGYRSGRVSILLLRRFALRHWRSAPGQTVLLVAIAALGVAVFVAVRLANRAAVSSFANFTETLTGQSDWILQPSAGEISDSVLLELRTELGSRPVEIVPVLEMSAASPPSALGESFTVLGLDIFSVANLAVAESSTPAFMKQNDARAEREDNPPETASSSGAGPVKIWISPAHADRVGHTIDLIFSERVESPLVAGVIPADPRFPRPPENLVIMDLPSLQRLADKPHRLDRIEFLVDPGPRASERSEELRQILERMARGRWTIVSPGARRQTGETMTRAFRLNLTVLSLIALLVGLYLIFQTLDGAVVRRRTEIAILRALGVNEATIRFAWLAESAVLGGLGGLLGLGLGWAGAQVTVRAVARTVNALYFATTVNSAGLSVTEALIAIALGLIAALAAGWWPAREAARVPPAHALGRHLSAPPGAALLRHAGLAMLLITAGVVCAQLPPLRFAGGARFPLAGYAAAFCWIFGGGVLSGLGLPWLARAARAWASRRATVRLASSRLKTPSSRHRLAVAALVCAVGMTAGMAILIASFEQTIRGWVQHALQADLYVSSKGGQTVSARNRISPEAAQTLAHDPDVAEADLLTSDQIQLDGTPVLLSGADLATARLKQNLTWVDAPGDTAIYDAARNRGLVLASESFCERFQKKRGDTVAIPTPAGTRLLTIAGVFADYGNERGSLFVDRAHLAHWFDDPTLTNLSISLKPGVDPESVRARWLKRYPGLWIYTQGVLRSEILRVFRQTFSITYALEIIGVIVAVAGLGLTLASVLLDRRDELTTLRALGFSRHEIAWTTSLEGVAIALAALVGGLVLSFALGWLLVHVINKQSFGWTLGFALPGWQLLALAVSVTFTGWIVSYFVGRWGAALPADQEE